MRHTERQTQRIQLLAMTGLLLALGWLPDALWAQGFTPQKPATVGTVPQRPGEALTTGQSATMYFMGHTGTATLDTSGTYDAVAWFRAGVDTVPPTWISGTGGDMRQCQPNMGDYGDIHIRVPLIAGTIVTSIWGTYCNGGFDPEYVTAFHYTGQANGPVFQADPPATAPPPVSCLTCETTDGADPVNFATGLYVQTDTDIDVPDVLPIRLTRTYRTNDTASRVFGIGAMHPYENYLLRDDLCTAARVIVPDGSYIHFARTSGTNCLDSTLQHTTTATAFYAATLAWDPVLQRYRLKFKDGTEWRFSDYGALVALLDRNGNTTTLTRAAGSPGISRRSPRRTAAI